jgi:hypothetical protein
MPLINQTIPNLINGVSQQPAALRLPTQHVSQVNCFPSVVEGLKLRPPTEHVAKILEGSLGPAFLHRINRDVSERYFVIIRQESIKVFTMDGLEKTVAVPDGVAYLNEGDPKTAFWAVTVADSTFILNMNKTVAMKADLSTAQPSEGLIFVKHGEYGTKYTVFVDGANVADKTTSTTDVLDLDTTTIATSLMVSLSALSGYTCVRVGSVIHIKKNDGTAFILKAEDGRGNTALQTIKGKVQRFSELPSTAPEGIIFAVDADPESASDTYYVKFEVNNPGETFGEGTWKETVAPSIPYQLDPTTMPHVLRRESDGTFTFEEQVWGDRIAGDADTAPDPSFVGSTIKDIFFYKDRLSFLSDENVIQSEVGEYFNFFPVTVTQTLDSDPIDVRASHTKVSILRHAVPFNTKVVLFSDQTQFILSSAGGLSFKTVDIDQSTEFEANLHTKPIGVGKSIFFVTNKGDYNGVREYFVDSDTATNDAADVTAHVPTYIPAGTFKLSASTIEDMVVAFTSGFTHGFYLYKFLSVNQQRVQSAWCQMVVGDEDETEVVSGEFIETTLYLVIQRSDGVYIEKMRLEPGRVDPYSSFTTCLDRRIDETKLLGRFYDPDTDATTITVPYICDAPMRVVTRADAEVPSVTPALSANIFSQLDDAIVVRGNWSTRPVWVGQIVNASVELSTFFYRKQSPTGGVIVESSGRLQLRRMTVVYADSGYFKFSVTPVGKPTSNYVFNGRIVGDGNNILGEVALTSGEFKVPILSKNDLVTITFSSDSFLPFRLINIKWEGMYVAKSQSL